MDNVILLLAILSLIISLTLCARFYRLKRTEKTAKKILEDYRANYKIPTNPREVMFEEWMQDLEEAVNGKTKLPDEMKNPPEWR